MAGRLDGKIAIVTGSANGIGRAIAQRFGKEGATVVVSDIDAKGAGAVAASINEAGGKAVAMPTNVAEKASIDELYDKTLAQFGGIDIVVNSAGLTDTERHFLEGDEAWWDKIHDVNLKGTFLSGLRAANHMARNGGGVIINVSSGGATRAHRGNAAYDATKGGIEALTRAMAVDLAPYGVRVNAVIPGSIDARGMDAEKKAERGKAIPMGRMGDPEDMTGAAVFLASDDAAYVTGQMVAVDGGILAAMRSPVADIFGMEKFPKLD
jgi:3-oxoacyl-[acyl-carrier protein] reductase